MFRKKSVLLVNVPVRAHSEVQNVLSVVCHTHVIIEYL
jgi:hypothetical protein